MRIGAIVQARMTSRRCPGKVLRPLGSSTVLDCLLNQLYQSKHLRNSDRDDSRSRICVATSLEQSDRPIANYCEKQGWTCVRGSLDDVASRFANALEQTQWSAFVRISGDSPLIDPRLVDAAIDRFLGGSFDLITNVFPRSFPRGQSVEVVRTSTFLQALREIEDPTQREHVTPIFYGHPQKYRIGNISAEHDQSHIQLAIDTEEDYGVVSAICGALTRPVWAYGWSDLARLSDDFRSHARGVAV